MRSTFFLLVTGCCGTTTWQTEVKTLVERGSLSEPATLSSMVFTRLSPLLLFGLLACSTPSSSALQSHPAASLATLQSEYTLVTHYDLRPRDLAPGPAYTLLQQFDKKPGEMIVSLASAAGVPAADSLFSSLPSAVSGKLSGWFGDAIGKEGSSELRLMAQWSASIFAEVEVNSHLKLPSAALQKVAEGTHTLQSLGFTIASKKIEVKIPKMEAMPGAGHARVRVSSLVQKNALQILLGEHRFGVLFGEAAYRAFQVRIQEKFGMTLREVLSRSVPCKEVASKVAATCTLGVCVGHSTGLFAVCEAALDQLDAQVHEQFRRFDVEALVLKKGRASVSGSGDSSRLEEGSWQASAQFGSGLREISNRFAGRAQEKR